MTVIDKILNEWSFRCTDGIVDLNDPTKLSILNEILGKFNLKIQMDENEDKDDDDEDTKLLLSELAEIQIKVGDNYILSSDLGNFEKGDKITITDKTALEEDWKITMINEAGVKDEFFIDRGDDYEV